VAREHQLSRFGTVSLDGTKIHANANRHSALSYGHAEAIEVQLQGEVQQLLALAEEADNANIPGGMSLPEELKRREDRSHFLATSNPLRLQYRQSRGSSPTKAARPRYGPIRTTVTRSGARSWLRRGSRQCPSVVLFQCEPVALDAEQAGACEPQQADARH